MKPKRKESIDDWTNKELSLRVGYEELAKAVIEQWDDDGRPKNDRQSIEIWYDTLRRLKNG